MKGNIMKGNLSLQCQSNNSDIPAIDIQISYEVVNPNQNMIILSEDESEQNENNIQEAIKGIQNYRLSY